MLVLYQFSYLYQNFSHLKRNWYGNADSYIVLNNSRAQRGKRKGVFSMNSESSAKKRAAEDNSSSDSGGTLQKYFINILPKSLTHFKRTSNLTKETLFLLRRRSR